MTDNIFASLLDGVRWSRDNRPDADYLRNRLRYEPDTGKLFWRDFEGMPSTWRTKYAGTEALKSKNSHGYLVGKIDDHSFYAHRIAWAIFYGAWPDGEIDHINGIPTDNRISNMREVTRVENEKNKFMRSDNLSGVSGVSWHKAKAKWRAQIRIDGRPIHLGYFDTVEAAGAARMEANKTFGFSERHGSPKASAQEKNHE